MSTIEIQGIKVSAAAAQNIEETGTVIADDVAALRSGAHTPETLLAHCLDGSDSDREQGWRDYVSAVAAAAAELPSVGDRVEGNYPVDPEDEDEGNLLAIDGDMAEVGWDSGNRSTQLLSSLRRVSR